MLTAREMTRICRDLKEALMDANPDKESIAATLVEFATTLDPFVALPTNDLTLDDLRERFPELLSYVETLREF